MLALHGYDAYGLEISQKAVDTANAYAAAELAQPSEYNFSGKVGKPANLPGVAKFVTGDFFSKNWEADCEQDGIAYFDLIYDYTVSVSWRG